MLRLRTFGGLFVENSPVDGDGAGRRRPLSVLALLASNTERGMSRDKLAAALWPESDAERARASLRQALSVLRVELSAAELVLGTVVLRLNPAVIGTDVGDFDRAVQAGDFERAVGCYTGPFLDGVYLRNAPEFERWVESERARHHSSYCRALERLAATLSEQGDQVASSAWWARRAAAEPLNARVVCAYMSALAAAGHPEDAIRHGILHAELVRSELDASPDAGVLALSHELQQLPHTPFTTNVRASPSRSVQADELSPLGVVRIDSVVSSTRALAEQQAARDSAHNVDANASTAAGSARRSGRRYAALLAVAVTLGAFFLVYARARDVRSPGVSDSPVVLVVPFDNVAGDSRLISIGRVATEWVTQSVVRSGVVPVLDIRLIGERFAAAGSQRGAIQRLITESGASVIVSASYYARGESVEFLARLTDARTGRVISVLRPIRTSLTSPTRGLDELGDRVQGALASVVDPRIAAVRDVSTPPPRFQAYQAYVQGLDVYFGTGKASWDYAGAIPLFQRAAALDTTFHLPLVWLAFAYGNTGNQMARDSVIDALERRRSALAPLDGFALEYFLSRRRGDREASYRALTSAAALAPGSNWTYLRATNAAANGRIDESIDAFRQLDVEGGWIEHWSIYWRSYAGVLHDAAMHDQEIAVAQRAVARTGDPAAYSSLFIALASRGDTARIDWLIDSLDLALPVDFRRSRLGSYVRGAAVEASVHDRPAAARALAESCMRWMQAHQIDSATASDSSEYDRFQTHSSDCAYMLGRLNEAERLAANVVRRGSGFWSDHALHRRIIVAAARRDSASVRRLSLDAYQRKSFASGSPMRRVLDASLAAVRGDSVAVAAALRLVPPDQASRWHTVFEIPPSLRGKPATRGVQTPTPQR